MGETTNNESSTTEAPPRNRQQPRPLGVETSLCLDPHLNLG